MVGNTSLESIFFCGVQVEL